MNDLTTRPAMPRPAWCGLPPSHDRYPLSDGETMYRHHHSRVLRPIDRSTVAVRMAQCALWEPEVDFCGCSPVIRLTGLDSQRELSVNDARWLAYALLLMVGAADKEAAQRNRNRIIEPARGVEMRRPEGLPAGAEL